MPFSEDGSWKPNIKQEKFLAIPSSIKEALYGGGAGSGKSEVLLMYGVVNEWIKNSQFKQLFTRRTFPELRNEIVPRTKEMYPRLGATFNKSDMCWTFPSGATIFLGHIENEDDARKYDSMQINLFTPDELTSYLEFQYLYIAFTRVRSSTPDLPSVIRAAGMPGGIGHTWVKKRFVDPAPEGNVIIKGRGGNKRIYVHATQDDNKKHIDPTYASSLLALPEAEKQAKLFGIWSAFEGQVFEEFRDRPYPDEPENAIHLIEPFDIPEWWPKVVVIDWGYSPPAMTYVGYGAISPSKRLYFYREQYWQKTSIEEWGGYVKQFIDRENPKIIRICKSAGQHRGQKTVKEQVEEALEQSIELTDNSAGSRVSTKLLLHEFFRWKQKFVPASEMPVYDETRAQWILRNRGIDLYKSYLALFDPVKEESNLPKLVIFKKSPEGVDIKLLPNAIKSCVYDSSHPQDVAEFPGDDPYDVIRYMVEVANEYFGDAENEFSKIQKQQELVDKLSTDRDWTAFYRNMRTTESLGEENIKPVRRYH